MKLLDVQMVDRTSMIDPINKLRGLAAEVRAREEQLRTQFEEFERRLKNSAGDNNIIGVKATAACSKVTAIMIPFTAIFSSTTNWQSRSGKARRIMT